MSDCGVCIGGGFDSDDGESFYFVERVSKRGVRCEECGGKVKAGDKYEFARWRQDGKLVSARSCLICAEIAWAFMCGERCYFVLWERMDDIYGDLGASCFSKLTTPEAKKELQRRWRKAMGLAA